MGKKKVNVKKLILCCLILANIIFICCKSDTFKSELTQYINVDSEEQEILKSEEGIEISSGTIVEQEFAVAERRLGQLHIYFKNSSPHESTGQVQFVLLDEERNELYTEKLDVSAVKHGSATVFDFSGNTEAINANHIVSKKILNSSKGMKLNDGETYILQIKGIDIESVASIQIILAAEEVNGEEILTIDGETIDNRQIYSAAVYYQFTYKVFVALIAILIMALIMVCIPWVKFDEKMKNRMDTKLTISILMSRIMFFMTPFVCFFINCKIVDKRTSTIISMLRKPSGILNLLTIGLVWWLIYTICNRTKYTTVITTMLFGIFAIVNYALIQFRGMPFMATDLSNIGTAMDVASSYTLSFDKPSIWVITITVIWCCVALAFENNKGVSIKVRIGNVIVLGALVLIFNQVFFNSTYLKDNGIKVSNFNPTGGYKNNGCVLGFMITVTTARMEKPEGYSVDNVQNIMSEYKSDSKENAQITEQTPNIIYVMNESFADLSIIGDLQLSEDCMPFYRSLSENCIKGNMFVSPFGGSTANTEFEVLTGNTMAFLPYHTVAYSGIIKNNIPSIATTMKDLGYVGNTAFHPGMVDSYNRNTIYPLLGFSNHISIEDVENPRNIRSFLSDEHNYEILIEDYENTRKENENNPYFMFNVTIQNHGGYGKSTGVVNGDIVINNSKLATEGLTQYVNLIKLSDDALKELIEYYEKQSEPTVVVFFGDHHPNLTYALYKKVYDGDDEEYTKHENYQKRFTVPFLIWANYDIEEQENVEISTNYLSAFMKQSIGMNMTGYEKYLMDLYENIPIITGNVYKGDNGTFYEIDEESEYSDLLNQYRLIQYNGLIDDKNIVEDFFYLSGN